MTQFYKLILDTCKLSMYYNFTSVNYIITQYTRNLQKVMELRKMGRSLSNKLEFEHKFVTKCILKGMTIPQIAKELDCSSSTVSNRIKKLFKQYNASCRSEFIMNVLAEIIKKDRKTLKEKEEELICYQKVLSKVCYLKNKEIELRNYLNKLEQELYLP